MSDPLESCALADRLDRYAGVLLDVGVRLQPGQLLGIDAQIEHAPLVRAIGEQAYRRGAHYVDIWYWDPRGKRSRVWHASEETLPWTPPWLDKRYEGLAAAKGALIRVVGDPEPDLLNNLDGRRAGLDPMPAIQSRLHAQRMMEVAWLLACYPNPRWAQSVFGAPDVDRLWAYLERFLRLDQSDPAAAWEARLGVLRTRARELTRLELDAVRFSGPGTDLTLGLIPGARWAISELPGPRGLMNVLNLPTEEVYTTPDYRRVEGRIRSTRPLALKGTLVRDLELTVVDGRITEVTASEGADAVRAAQSIDAGAAMFGEVALVDNTSPIGQSGITFLETLLDENATCHIAWGFGIPTVLGGWRELTPDQLRARGVNQSATHVDFMVGGSEVNVTGIRRDGTTVEILQGEQWVLDSTL